MTALCHNAIKYDDSSVQCLHVISYKAINLSELLNVINTEIHSHHTFTLQQFSLSLSHTYTHTHTHTQITYF